jgi:alpha-beta hydrolase superfamily lysophospholipase
LSHRTRRTWSALAPKLLSGLLLLGGLGLGGCSPTVMAEGPSVASPHLDGDQLVMKDGVALPLRQWMPTGQPRAIILALHGFNDYSKSFEAPAADWAAHGIATFAYDQRGFGYAPDFGYWPGTHTMVEDLRTAAALIHARYPDTPLYLLGESMGGALIMTAETEPNPPICDGVILSAPAAWGRELQGPVAVGALWFFAHTVPWLEVSGANLNVTPSDNIPMLRALGADPHVIKETRVDAVYGLVDLMDHALKAAPNLKTRALILYGQREQVLPSSAAMTMLRRLPPPPERPRIAIYQSGYHMLLRDIQSDLVREDVAAWVLDPKIAALPSGADARAEAMLKSNAPELDAVKQAAVP